MPSRAGGRELERMLCDIEQGSRIESDHIVGDLLNRAGNTQAPPVTSAYACLRAYEARLKREATSRETASAERLPTR
jgi:2-dehydropantoate 2-reductase